MDALLTSQRIGKELLPFVGPEPELDLVPDHEHSFGEYIRVLDRQIQFLQGEAKRLMEGKRASYFA